MEVWVKMHEFSVGLDPGYHAWNNILSAQQTLRFGLDAGPCAGTELTQEFAVKTGMQPQAFGNGQDHLSVGHVKADFIGHMHSRQ